MDISVPASVNYPSPLVAVPSRLMLPPREGNKQIPCQIDWGSMGGAGGSVLVNLGNNATLEFSQITALKVDNSLCGATIHFVFPDTGDTVTIPAYSPNTVIEVFSQQTQFYVVADAPISTDVTRFQILNFLPPPISVSVSTEQQTSIISGISAAVAGSTQVIPTDANGTLENLQVQFGVANAAADSNVVITLTDGVGKVIAACPVFVRAGSAFNVGTLNLTDIAVRFQQGIEATISGGLVVSGQFNVNAYYRLP